jgi:cation diffusion facilitator CzcD-associated flavoprotein CzcO
LSDPKRTHGTVTVLDALVVGGGPAGMATGYALGKAGLHYRILEQGDRVAGAWHGYWDTLRLNSPRFLSSLPGMPIDRGAGRWPTRTDMIAYFDRYAAEHSLPIEFGQRVLHIDRDDGLWRVETPDGPRLARSVVVATGLNARPYTPPWPGSDDFAGLLLHASEYRNPRPFEGKRVLVVGPGSSGKDIAVDLISARAEQVWLSVRTPPLMFPTSILGIPADMATQVAKRLPRWMHPLVNGYSLLANRLSMGDLRPWGLGRPPEGLMTAMKTRGHGATIERGFVPAVKAGQIGVVPAVERFDGSDVILSDGRRLTPDVVIAATGQHTSLDEIVGHLDVLGEDGRPRLHAALCAPNAPNLYFVGYRLPPGQLPDLRPDTRRVARAIQANRVAGSGFALPRERSPSGYAAAAAARETPAAR